MGDTIKRIILRCPNPLGDFIMSLPAAEKIARCFPDAKLTLMIKTGYLSLVEGMEWYSETLEYDKKGKLETKDFLDAVARVRRGGYDMGVLFTNSFSSALMMWLAGVRERVGYARARRGWMLTGALKPKTTNGKIAPLPMVDYYAELSFFMGCGLPGKAPRITLTEREADDAAEFLKRRGIDLQRPLLGIVPGAGYGSAKMWPSPYFAEAGDALAEALGAKPIIFAEAKDSAAAGEIAGRMSHKALDMSREQNSIALLKQLMARCALVLTTDSGPRHIAAALGVPVVVVIGSADPIYSTTSHEHVAVERVPVDCSPCMLRECPTDHRCMKRLKPDQVIRSALNLLEKVKTG